tara:strand:- start:3846 stop:4793 length:948 start_codon:yes stop_codon:yes gene_type:complete
MGFLDNSGDIILDAVLTDLGRKRLSEGNGKFRVAKFAFGDDEIDYGLYEKNNPSGSAYYDVAILQTPVFEAFTNNMSSMKSRLLSYTENDLLYLPVIQHRNSGDSKFASTQSPALSSYIVLVDQTTVNALTTDNNSLDDGIMNGFRPDQGSKRVTSDQGLNTTELSAEDFINPVLLETQYFVQIDNRLGFLTAPDVGEGDEGFTPTSIDDDDIATYIFTDTDDSGTVTRLSPGDSSAIAGPRGTRLSLKVASSLDLKTSTYLFGQLGSGGTVDIVSGTKTLAAADYQFIDTVLRISGVSTGYTLDIPLRFVKKTT